jgi:hypothetical protein
MYLGVGKEFLGQPSYNQIFKEDPAPLSYVMHYIVLNCEVIVNAVEGSCHGQF